MLEFDQEALRQALGDACEIPRRRRRPTPTGTLEDRVFLSRATLVVVPAVLIGHWTQQVEVRGGAERNGVRLGPTHRRTVPGQPLLDLSTTRSSYIHKIDTPIHPRSHSDWPNIL